MLSRKTIRIIAIIMLLSLIFQAWWMFIGPGRELYDDVQEQLIFPESSWSPAVTEYSSERMSPQFQELWMMRDIYFGAGPDQVCNLAAFQSKLIFEGSFDQNQPKMLNRLDLETGEILWHVSLESEWPSIMTNNTEIIFFGSGIQGNIIAYDIESGERIWESSLSSRGKNIISHLRATDESLYVNSSTGTSSDFRVFDTYTGQPQKWETSFDAFPILFVNNDVLYHQTLDTRVLATGRWKYRVGGDV